MLIFRFSSEKFLLIICFSSVTFILLFADEEEEVEVEVEVEVEEEVEVTRIERGKAKVEEKAREGEQDNIKLTDEK